MPFGYNIKGGGNCWVIDPIPIKSEAMTALRPRSGHGTVVPPRYGLALNLRTDEMIETERLLLRQPSGSDFAAWATFLSDAEATRFIGGSRDTAEAWRNLCLFAGAWSVQGYSNFSVIEKATGRWVGRAGAWSPPDWPGQEIGWAFSREVWGRGYATEAATRCLKWAFEELGWAEAVHVIHPENFASIAVATKLGAVPRETGTAENYRLYVSTKEAFALKFVTAV
ncbi:RimJ/RimL family protein N-acetyltransferase [Pseudorhizobium tarimense]|uniref:RimJ/RimL family protein N-acetyltransferase n=1 Tax=Pseudorhizobium tarimense TaxID=1079109 RepID=A0ABV2HBP7_9HYPH|nr:GNAT family N-acetyltransferase [Pseudorhizobium tarimense]MCJ8521061.1 GNAT family N-acetyltransferase [Pseudorhizobium tarimense]